VVEAAAARAGVRGGGTSCAVRGKSAEQAMYDGVGNDNVQVLYNYHLA
jgi:hypothetical protein